MQIIPFADSLHFPSRIRYPLRSDVRDWSTTESLRSMQCSKGMDPLSVPTVPQTNYFWKLRCSGDKPSCQRCLRLNRSCLYGNRTARDGNPPVIPNHESTGATSLNPRITVTTSNYNRLCVTPSLSPPQLSGLPEKAYIGIPSPLLSELVEIYFSHVYNASLLLHKSRFKQAVRSQTVQPHVLLSVCALASKYVKTNSQTSSRNRS